MRKSKGKFHYLFWIKSSRGTDKKAVFSFQKKLSDDAVEKALESWCSVFGAWNHSDNRVSYGWRQIEIPSPKELEKRWETACEQYRKAKEERDIVAAMMSPQDDIHPDSELGMAAGL